MNNNLPSSSRDDLADRMLDLALAEKAGGKSPPDLSRQILARAEEPVTLPEHRQGERVAPTYGSFVPVGVSLCLLAIAAITAVLWQPDLAGNLDVSNAFRKHSTRDGELLRAYELEQDELLKTATNEGALLKAFEEEEGKFLGSLESIKAVLTGKIRAEVEDGLTQARAKAGSNAESAKADLKIMLESVDRAVDLEKDVRIQLRDQIESALKEASRREIEFSEKRAVNEEARAAVLERNGKQYFLREYPLASLETPAIQYRSDSGVVRRYTVNGRTYTRAMPQTVTKSTNPGRSDPRILKPVTDEDFAQLVARTDVLHGVQGIESRLKERGDSLVADVSRYKKQLDARGIKIEDPTREGIATKVNAEITAVSSPKKLVEISVGSDDGIRNDQELDVYRNATYLGKVRVMRTAPDKSVAALVMESMRGPILKGDKIAANIILPRLPEPAPEAEPVPPAEPDPAGDKFDVLPENDFAKAKAEPLSTFSIDVDTASYSKVRQILTQARQLPPGEAVRLEELVNYFPYDYAPPTDDKPFAAHVETAACPWNAAHRLVRIGLKGRVIEDGKRPPCNLVFLVDVSGSMDEPNRLPLVTHGLKMLAGELTERDTVAIVVYAGAAGLVLPPTRGDAKPTIYTALSQLKAGGSTNGGEGIELAYKTCQENFVDGGVNRVILCTDGDFNVGLTSTGLLVDLAKEKAQKGVFLSALGFGMGNHNDEMLEAVSNKANGNHAFIDSLNEARKVLVQQIGGTLITIAKDVKIQVEFDPAAVESYRLLGYENRLLANEDFSDDKKDAGEIGAGHTVTALYEIVPAVVEQKKDVAKEEGKLLTLKLRYKQPDGDTSALLEFPVKDSGRRFAEATPDFQFAASVASFGMILRKSQNLGDSNFAAVAEIASAAKGTDPHGYRAEFVELVKKAAELSK